MPVLFIIVGFILVELAIDKPTYFVEPKSTTFNGQSNFGLSQDQATAQGYPAGFEEFSTKFWWFEPILMNFDKILLIYGLQKKFWGGVCHTNFGSILRKSKKWYRRKIEF